MITLQHVYKSYGQRPILEDVNLIIEEGEMVAIIGPSGSGKSTLLNMIGFIEKMDRGE